MISAKVFGFVILAFSLSGCVASAKFHPKTGQDFTPSVARAVRVEPAEVDAVVSAGGFPIGTISARALSTRANGDDIADKAAVVAAKSGGTHIALLETGVESYTYVQAGQVHSRCSRGDGTRDCETSFTPPVSTTVDNPTAEFEVYRVAPADWDRLPEMLRPVSASSKGNE